MTTEATAETRNGLVTGGVLLVGSVPLRSADEVFQLAATELGDRVDRIPDGETGPRSDWIVWQYPVLSSRPEFEVCPPGADSHRALPRLRVSDDESIDTLRFEQLGYAQAATSSYRIFARRKRDGLIPSHCRFQVSLPTPLAPIAAFVAPEDQARIEPLYEAAMLAELATIFDSIPHDQLAVQWDTNFEFAMLDGVMPTWFADPRSSIVERLVRLGRSVPGDVQLGYHFCHGHERHHTRAATTRAAARRDRERAVAEPRPLARLDPPPRAGRPRRRALLRDARAAAAASRDAALPRCAPPEDGVAGAEARIVAAQRFVHDFGVATDCGWGRHRSQDVAALVELHRRVERAAGRPPRGGVVRVASRLGPRARRDVDARARRRLRHGVRQRRSPRLVPQPRSDRGGARSPAERRRHHDRLLGRHRHLARPAEAADVRHPGRRDHRRQLAQVPARRGREVPRRPEGRVPAAALPEGREAARNGSKRCSVRRCSAAASTSSPRRTPCTSIPTSPTPSRHGSGRSAPTGTSSSTQGTSATRARAAASGSSTRRCGSSARSPKASSAPIRRTPRTRADLDNPERMKAHAAYRDRVLPAAATARLLPRDARARRA